MRAAEWLRSRRFPARAPIVVLDPYGFRRALRELGWEPARLVVAERFVPRLRGLTGFPGAGCWRTGRADSAGRGGTQGTAWGHAVSRDGVSAVPLGPYLLYELPH